ncbi:MAG: stage V sporulation protein D, partial [Candidatus Omnitrophica bacterium]|nr:stage V sporulation protein D [Candidatus Omnitrophota bacterium]
MESRRHSLRFSLIFLALIACLIFFAVKLVFIHIFRSEYLTGLAAKQHHQLVEVEPVRGSIYDRKMRPVAFNVSVYSFFASPRTMTQDAREEAMRELPSLLQVNPDSLAASLNKISYFVWVKRKISPELAEKVRGLKIKGLDFRKESKRFYPGANLAAHVVGFADIDNNGLEGMELSYNRELKGKPGWMRLVRDARQTGLMLDNDFVPPHDGLNLVLTIDETIQYLAERALQEAYEKYKAKAATIIVMDTRTGGILALANRPTYDLESYSTSQEESRTDRAVSYVYEPGSVFKVVTAAAALQEGRFKEDDKIFCENGSYRIANNILTDHQHYGTLTFTDVIGFSSNIGVAKIAQKLGAATVYRYAKKFRFGMKTGIDLKGEVGGWLKSPSRWSKTSIGAVPIGYEVTVTPLQLLCMMATVANKGVYLKPFVVKSVQDNQGHVIKSFGPQVLDPQVITEETALRLTPVLINVVEHGTARKAQIPGVKVAGKT